MSIPQSGGGLIESVAQLAEYMEAGNKPAADWRIGTEHEKFGWLTDSRLPLPYAGERSISALFAGLTEKSYVTREGTIYGLYQARYGINVIRISERLSAEAAPPIVAKVLGLAVAVPTLVIRRVAYTYNDTPVEYRVSWLDTREHEYLSDLWKGDIAQ